MPQLAAGAQENKLNLSIASEPPTIDPAIATDTTSGAIIDNVYRGLQSEINRSAERGEIERVDIKMLFISIMSLNIFTFLAYPFMEPLMGELMVNRERFLAERKAENIETILRRIKKQ